LETSSAGQGWVEDSNWRGADPSGIVKLQKKMKMMMMMMMKKEKEKKKKKKKKKK